MLSASEDSSDVKSVNGDRKHGLSGSVHPKIKRLSSLVCLHVIPNLFNILL